jgi:hypothetical protein
VPEYLAGAVDVHQWCVTHVDIVARSSVEHGDEQLAGRGSLEHPRGGLLDGDEMGSAFSSIIRPKSGWSS